MKRKAVFLDRDGTIIEERNYLSNPEEVRLIEGAPESILALSNAGYFVVMVSNQSGVARGLFGEREVRLVNDRVEEELKRFGAQLDAIYYCPHYEKGTVSRYAIACSCRKPQPGMGYQAAKDHGLELSESYMIGDKLSDVEFGRNCGMKNAILVRTGHGRQQALPWSDYGIEAADICAAASIILKQGDKV